MHKWFYLEGLHDKRVRIYEEVIDALVGQT